MSWLLRKQLHCLVCKFLTFFQLGMKVWLHLHVQYKNKRHKIHLMQHAVYSKWIPWNLKYTGRRGAPSEGILQLLQRPFKTFISYYSLRLLCFCCLASPSFLSCPGHHSLFGKTKGKRAALNKSRSSLEESTTLGGTTVVPLKDQTSVMYCRSHKGFELFGGQPSFHQTGLRRLVSPTTESVS